MIAKSDLDDRLLAGPRPKTTVVALLERMKITELRRLARRIATSPIGRRRALGWIRAGSTSLRKLGCWVLIESKELATDEALAAAIKLAEDDDWGVREESTYLFRRILLAELPRGVARFVDLMASSSPRVRRALAVGAGRVATGGRSIERKSWGVALIAIVEPAIADPDVYVRKNLGPFAIGSYLLSYYPGETFAAIERWAGSRDALRRHTAARALSAVGARSWPTEAAGALANLLADRDARVARAARSAAAKLARSEPARACPVFRSWAGADGSRLELISFCGPWR